MSLGLHSTQAILFHEDNMCALSAMEGYFPVTQLGSDILLPAWPGRPDSGTLTLPATSIFRIFC